MDPDRLGFSCEEGKAIGGYPKFGKIRPEAIGRYPDLEMKGKIMVDRLMKNPKVEVIWNTVMTDVLGDKLVNGLKLKNVTNNEEQILKVEGVFAAIGHTQAIPLE